MVWTVPRCPFSVISSEDQSLMAVLCTARVAQSIFLALTQNTVWQTAWCTVDLRVMLIGSSRPLTATGGISRISVSMHVVWRAVMGVGKVLVGEAKIVHLVPVVHLVPRLITSERHGREGGGVFHGDGSRVHGPGQIFHVDHVKVDDAAEEGRSDGVSPGDDHAGSVGLGRLGVADVQDGEDEERIPEDQESDHHQQHHHYLP